MSDALELVVSRAEIHRRWYAVGEDRMSLSFRPDTPYEAWEEETTALLEVARGIQWLAGDALAFGEERWPDLYAQVLDAGRYRYESIDRMARVSKAIGPERRRPTVGYYQHMAVASLPLEEQERLLDHAAEHGSTVDQMRQLVKVEHRRLDRERAALLPAPQLSLEGITIEQADARSLPLAAESVDLICTSPPYGLDSESIAKYRVPDEASAWVQLMVDFCREAERVLTPQGRLLVNVPLDTTTGGHRPTYAQLVAAARGAKLRYRTTIIWVDAQLGKSTARGSIESPGGINVVTPAEMVLVAHKGDWIRPPGAGTSQLDHEGWVVWTNGLWPLPGEARGWEGFEAAFPAELPRRLLKLFSFREDVVCDPFLGSGTTAVVAYELGRTCLGFDLDPLQVASAQRRLALVSRGRR